jgi:hypothetical protein
MGKLTILERDWNLKDCYGSHVFSFSQSTICLVFWVFSANHMLPALGFFLCANNLLPALGFSLPYGQAC